MSSIPVTQSWIFIILTPGFSVTWSCRNHSNMLICCLRNIFYLFILLSMLIMVFTAYYFCETWYTSIKKKIYSARTHFIYQTWQ